MEQIRPTTALGLLLDWVEENEASDLHVQAGRPPRVRIHGALSVVPEEIQSTTSPETVAGWIRENFTSETWQKIESRQETDLSLHFRDQRYRANFSRQQGRQSFSLRIVPQQKLKLEDLQLPDSLRDIVDEPRGLVLLTGATGQGKSTTARALIQELNETRPLRIITVEDPIEYIFEPQLCQFEQREVGIDTESFERGIRNAMRQDPNVIFVGEIRDRESIFAAMQAAETGHLVITTLHADTVAQAIPRIREYYPTSEQANISSLLARHIHTIVCQRLIPNVQGTRTPCLEILKRDAGVEAAIAANDLNLLSGIVEASVNQGMHTFDQYLVELLAERIITRDVAERYAMNRQKLDMTLRGIVTQQGILRPDRDR